MERSGMSEKCFFVMIYVEIILLSRWAQNNAIYTTKIEDKEHNRLSKDSNIVTTEKSAMIMRILKTQLVAACSIVLYFGGILLLTALIKEDNIRNNRDSPCQSIHDPQFLTVSLLFGVGHILGKLWSFVLHNLGIPAAISLTFFYQ